MGRLSSVHGPSSLLSLSLSVPLPPASLILLISKQTRLLCERLVYLINFHRFFKLPGASGKQAVFFYTRDLISYRRNVKIKCTSAVNIDFATPSGMSPRRDGFVTAGLQNFVEYTPWHSNLRHKPLIWCENGAVCLVSSLLHRSPWRNIDKRLADLGSLSLSLVGHSWDTGFEFPQQGSHRVEWSQHKRSQDGVWRLCNDLTHVME